MFCNCYNYICFLPFQFKCKLINLSTTNPSVVNGNVVQKELILTHNDMLNIGMRRFYFRTAGTLLIIHLNLLFPDY